MKTILRAFAAMATVMASAKTSSDAFGETIARMPAQKPTAPPRIKGESPKKKAFRRYKRIMRGVTGRLTWQDFRRGTKQINTEQVAKCQANRARRQPMFERMRNARVVAAYRHAEDYLFRRYNHSTQVSNNGAQRL